MSDRKVLEQWTEHEFAFLITHGFAAPVLSRESWSISLDWFCPPIALEIELDYRELEVSCLVVELRDGKLPDGYYVADGAPCRYHLLKVIRERHWPVDSKEIDKLLVERKKSTTRDINTMKNRVQAYKSIVKSAVQSLLSEKCEIFSR